MDRRLDTRLPADFPVCVVRLQDGTKTAGKLLDISDSGICALLPGPVVPGTLVEIDILQVSLYGEIVYSTPENAGHRTGIFVEPVLLEKSNVARIVESYLHSSEPADMAANAVRPPR